MAQKGSKQTSKKNIQKGKQNAKTSESHCAICLDIIIEADESNDGQDAIYCEGMCQGWLHRGCAGLSKKAFNVMTEPYYCPHCLLSDLKKEIASLKDVVQILKLELTTLTTHLSHPSEHSSSARNKDEEAPSAVSSRRSEIPQSTYSSIVRKKDSLLTLSHSSINSGRKFNLLVFGVKECPQGTARHLRTTKDLEVITSILSTVDHMFTTTTIRDCIRLGRYKIHSNRPVLVMLNSSFAVSSVLSKRSRLSQLPNISIKPDLSPKVRDIASKLLKERRSLISNGVDSKLIKLRGNLIYVNNVKHGVVVDSVFKLLESLKTGSSTDQSTDVSIVIHPSHSHNPTIGDSSDVSSLSVSTSANQIQPTSPVSSLSYVIPSPSLNSTQPPSPDNDQLQ